MSYNPTSPVTGSAVTGFTAPTYTLTADIAPGPNGKQYAVTGLGGTQAGVDSHTVSRPFTLTMFKPQRFSMLGMPNPVTGVIKDIPINKWKIVGRKGAKPAVNQPDRPVLFTLTIDIPAGTDTYEAEEIRAGWSAFVGHLWGNSASICDTFIQGTL